MGGRFEEEDGGFLSFSEAAIRLGVCKCTWMALSTVSYGGFLFWGIFLVFQLITPFRFNLSSTSPSGERAFLHHSLLIGTELGLLAMVAFMTFLVPTLIMTWITALVFEYLFGRGLLGHREGLVQLGSRIAKDISWLALKSTLKRGNVGAFIFLVLALLSYGLRDSINKYI